MTCLFASAPRLQYTRAKDSSAQSSRPSGIDDQLARLLVVRKLDELSTRQLSETLARSLRNVEHSSARCISPIRTSP